MMLLIILAFFVVTVTADAIPEEERVNGENGWCLPKLGSSCEWFNKDAAELYLANLKLQESLLLNPVNMYLYTKSNPSIVQEIFATATSIKASKFNATNPTWITIHGWSGSKDGVINTGVREALFKKGDFNVIAVDWGRGRSLDYASSVLAVPNVGKKVAALVNFLISDFNMKLSDLIIAGLSLGAHVAGFTGKSILAGKPKAIFGCDPALPFYWYDKPDTRLSSTDADYVEIIHTNAGELGFARDIGTADFFPNGGQSQPGCELDITGFCSHLLSATYLAEALEKCNFGSIKCSNNTEAIAQECGLTLSSIRMGEVENAGVAVGTFLVPVNNDSPYGTL